MQKPTNSCFYNFANCYSIWSFCFLLVRISVCVYCFSFNRITDAISVRAVDEVRTTGTEKRMSSIEKCSRFHAVSIRNGKPLSFIGNQIMFISIARLRSWLRHCTELTQFTLRWKKHCSRFGTWILSHWHCSITGNDAKYFESDIETKWNEINKKIKQTKKWNIKQKRSCTISHRTIWIGERLQDFSKIPS